MKGLSNICGIAEAPALKELHLVAMMNLDPRSLKCFAGHPTLQKFGAGLSSTKRNAYAEAVVDVEPMFWASPEYRAQVRLELLKDQVLRTLN